MEELVVRGCISKNRNYLEKIRFATHCPSLLAGYTVR